MLKKERQFGENREVLRNLYGTMKGLDDYLRFVMLTGVSRFAKVGVFSGMNNLQDISLDESFSQIVGFSQEELERYFGEHLLKLAAVFNMPLEELMPHIQEWYNGFSFDGTHRLYNPFSILKLLSEFEFRNYWFSTGTPTFLMDLIREQKQISDFGSGVCEQTDSWTNGGGNVINRIWPIYLIQLICSRFLSAYLRKARKSRLRFLLLFKNLLTRFIMASCCLS